MNEVKVGACSFGDGSPRVCIPLMGRTGEDILEQSKLIVDECHRLDKLYKDYPELRVSVIEWRADYYDDRRNSFNCADYMQKDEEIRYFVQVKHKQDYCTGK